MFDLSELEGALGPLRVGAKLVALATVVAVPAVLSASSIGAGDLVTFSNGTVADATQVNANFGAVATAINDNDSRLTTVEGEVSGLDSRIATLEGTGLSGVQVIHSPDTRVGCPPSFPADNGTNSTDMVFEEITLAAAAPVFIDAHSIENPNGRSDLILYVDGAEVKRCLVSQASSNWENCALSYGTTLSAGTHRIALRQSRANSWGCGATWGGFTTIVFGG